MLMLGSKVLTIEGITVFPDHADEQQYWYLPGPVGLAKRDGTPQFTLIRYRPAVADGGVKGGGFLTMEVELKLKPEVERKIMSAISAQAGGRPRLSVVPFDEGTVQIVALNIQGSGGTNAPAPLPGAFVAVEAILGASKPSLAGNNNAVFSLTLSQEGSIILDQAFRQGAMPVGVIYDLKYTALRPALDVEIKANYKRIYDHLSMGIDLTAGAVIYGVPVFLEAGIDLAFEKLRQDGVIEIKVINFANDADAKEKEQWALDFFKQQILAEWFKPTLPPVTFDNNPPGTNRPGTNQPGTNQPGTTPPGTNQPGTNQPGANQPGTNQPGTNQPGTTPPGTNQPGTNQPGSNQPSVPAGGGNGGTATTTGRPPSGGGNTGSTPRPPGGGEAPGGETGVRSAAPAYAREVWAFPFSETERQAARLEKRVQPPAPGYDIALLQLASSDQVTLTFLGGEVAPVVQVNSVEQQLTAQRQLTMTVAAGETHTITASYPASAGAVQEFRLFFDFDKPRENGWSVQPPSASYQGYLNNRTNPLDSRFETSTGQAGGSSGGQRGADALRAWLQNSLGSPRRVSVDSYASFEGDVSTAVHNRRLTERRLEAALGVIGGNAEIASSAAHGFTEARNANRVADPSDRVVIVRGASASGQQVTITGTLTRAAAPGGGNGGGGSGGTATPTTPTTTTPTTTTPATNTPTTTPPTSNNPRPTTGQTPPIPQTPPMGIKLAFSLKKIEQVEDKTFTLRYNRQSTVQRSYAPQGLVRLLTEDLNGPPHFIEVDLNSAFFQKLNLEVEAPAVFEQIGLLKSDVAIEYGRPNEPANLRYKDISFRPAGAKVEKTSFFLNSQLDLNYRYTTQYHFDPLSGWDGEKISYELPQTTTLDRTLLVNPFRDFGFMEVQVVPGDMDPAMVDSTEVHLRYEDPGRWARDKVITVSPNGPAQSWKLRLSDPERRSFTYRFLHRMKDGTTKETDPITTRIPSVTVNDPFDEPLIVEFFPNYDGSRVHTLFVNVVYVDPVRSTRREEQLRFVGQTMESQRLRFARSDPTSKTITFQMTILGVDNSVRKLPAVSTENSIVFLGEHMTSETSTKRRASMTKKTSQEAEAAALQEGKTYGLQGPVESEQLSGAPSSTTDKRQLMMETFEKLMDIMFEEDGTKTPVTVPVTAPTTAPTTTGAPASGYSAPAAGAPATGAPSVGSSAPGTEGGTIHTPGVEGTSTKITESGKVVYNTLGTGSGSAAGTATSPAQPAPATEQPLTQPKTNGAQTIERFGISVGPLIESYRADRAMEAARRAAATRSPATPQRTPESTRGANGHSSDSNKSPLRSERHSPPFAGPSGRMNAETMERVSLPGGKESRPESAPSIPRATNEVLMDAFWGSYGSPVEKAQERLRIAARQKPQIQDEVATVLEVILGTDDRVQVTNTTAYPWRCICSLLITSQTGITYIGTGWLVAPRLLLTAGHCVYMADEGGWATQIDVIPGRNGASQPYGCVSSFDFRSVTGWTVDGNRDYDYGAILLPEDQRLGDQLGWFGFAVRDDSYLNTITLNLAGYPGDGGPARADGTMWYNSRSVASLTEKQISYEIDTYGGQSGSPVWEMTSEGYRYGVGIHTWGGTVSNGATRITQEVFDNIVLWTSQVP